MTQSIRYRLTCYEGGYYSFPSCVFDEKAGPKPCVPPVKAEVSRTKRGPIVEVQIGNSELQKIWLPHGDPTKKEQAVFNQKSNYRRARRNFGQNGAYNWCSVSQVNTDERAKLSKIKKQHPRIWNLINPYLDRKTNYLNLEKTFRELAVYLVNEGIREDGMFPAFLIEVGAQVCNHDADWPAIPIYSSATASPQCRLEVPQFKACHPANGGYDIDLENTANDQNCFWNMLIGAIPQTPFNPGMNSQLQVLDIGCGVALAAIPLVEFLQQYRLEYPESSETNQRKVQYTGVDVDEKSIEEARKNNPRGFNFVANDAKRFLDADLKRTFDVILFRHPGPMLDSDFEVGHPWVWWNLMRKAHDHLSKNGILIISGLRCYEYAFAQKLFADDIPARIYATGRNPVYENWGRDSFVLIVGK